MYLERGGKREEGRRRGKKRGRREGWKREKWKVGKERRIVKEKWKERERMGKFGGEREREVGRKDD